MSQPKIGLHTAHLGTLAATITLPALPTLAELPFTNSLAEPPSNAALHTGGSHPGEPSIVDFNFAAIEGDVPVEKPIVRRFGLEEVLYDPGPDALMRSKGSVHPNLRWIHLPFNSMKYTRDLMTRVCADIGFTRPDDVVNNIILSDHNWQDRLHLRAHTEGFYATFLETSCFEICFTGKSAQPRGPSPSYYETDGTSMGFFVPFLHWGTEDVLISRDQKIKELIHRVQHGQSLQPPPYGINDSPMLNFYTKMMTEQLFDRQSPLHLRRTLDQYYYTHALQMSDRDGDQVVSKRGPQADHSGIRPIQLVDQLWIWVLGSNTVISCFDRRWLERNHPQTNVYDNILWQLQSNGQAKRVKSGFELAHLIIEQATSYFFDYSHSVPSRLRFKDIFRKAICEESDVQIRLFRNMTEISKKASSMKLCREDQNRLFDVHCEFSHLLEVRDILDELTMMNDVVEQQLFLLSPLLSLHFQDAFERHKRMDPKKIVSEVDLVKHEIQKLNWDERDWFKRTKHYLKAHHKELEDMMTETWRVYDALRDTISLKQSNASIFEAHASRGEAEAVTLFTWVSSSLLPMSFISSIFGMNAVELEQGGKMHVRAMMVYIFPIGIVVSLLFVVLTFSRVIREKAVKAISSETKRWEVTERDLVDTDVNNTILRGLRKRLRKRLPEPA